ncbi:RICIN domain-containing protein [Actinoplanes sp. NPDC049118]|uniref:RICIN domain-containing protein n=1 Tax=Actinoplanes sp. NPDC049118 TaxID=3155769 RepID=UPI0033EF95FF
MRVVRPPVTTALRTAAAVLLGLLVATTTTVAPASAAAPATSAQAPAAAPGRGVAVALVNGVRGACLDHEDWGNAPRAGLWGCHYGANQRWRLVDVERGLVVVQNEASGKCLDAYRWGEQAKMSDCRYQESQLWFVHTITGNQFALASPRSGCLEHERWGDSNRAVLGDCTADYNQRWVTVV